MRTILGVCLVWSIGAIAQQQAIDPAKSVMTIHVGKSGLFSAVGHEHEISAAIESGSVNVSAQSVELHVKTGSLRVVDKNVSDKDREKIQSTMLGPEVLDAQRFPEIVFRSTRAESTGPVSWKVYGDLALHGESHPVAVAVTDRNGRYAGTSIFKQTDFGIKPVKAGGGSVRVKDEVQIEFDIVLK